MKQLLKLSVVMLLYCTFYSCAKKDVTTPGSGERVTIPNLVNTVWNGDVLTISKQNDMPFPQSIPLTIILQPANAIQMILQGTKFSSSKATWKVQEFTFYAQLLNNKDTITFEAPISNTQLRGTTLHNHDQIGIFTVNKQ